MGKQSLFIRVAQALHEPRPNHSPDSMRRSHGVQSQPRGSRMPGDTSRLTQAATRTVLRFMLRSFDHGALQKILRTADVPSQLISNQVES
jgi:hypothetical protein